MMSSHDSVELHHVGLRRGEQWILRDINWTLPPGVCAAVLGPNGAGKSTLTRILGCHLWPTEGYVRILGGAFGNDVPEDDDTLPANLIELRRSIRLVQSAGPYDMDPQLTAREVVLTGFFGTIGLYDPATPDMLEEADRVLSQVGLIDRAGHQYATLSSGERVRSLIARALVREPRLLLLDEPTAGLDLLGREQVLATIQAMFETEPDPPTLIMVTHHVEELPPVTSQVLLLSEGRAAASGTPAEVLRPEVLSAVYRCNVEVREAGGRYYAQVHPATWDQLLHRP